MRHTALFLIALFVAVLPYTTASAQEPASLSCSIVIEPSRAEVGEEITVVWETSGATHLWVSSLIDLPEDTKTSDTAVLKAPAGSYLFLLIAQSDTGERVRCQDLLTVLVVLQTSELGHFSRPSRMLTPEEACAARKGCVFDRFPNQVIIDGKVVSTWTPSTRPCNNRPPRGGGFFTIIMYADLQLVNRKNSLVGSFFLTAGVQGFDSYRICTGCRYFFKIAGNLFSSSTLPLYALKNTSTRLAFFSTSWGTRIRTSILRTKT